MNPREVYIDNFPKPVHRILAVYKSGRLIIPPDSNEYEGEPVEQLLLGTFRNHFLFTRDRNDMKLTLRTNIPFFRSVLQYADNQRVAGESAFYPQIQGLKLDDIPPIIYNKFLDTIIRCCHISPSTPEEIVPYLVKCYNRT